MSLMLFEWTKRTLEIMGFSKGLTKLETIKGGGVKQKKFVNEQSQEFFTVYLYHYINLQS